MADAALSAIGLDPTAVPSATLQHSSPTTQPAPPPLETSQLPTPFHISLNSTQPTTLVLLHGILSSHLEFTHVIPLLSAHHLLLVDLPGHSNSFSPSTPRKPESYSIASMADAVAAVIRAHANGGKAHVVGVSMGGFVGLELARRYPELCASAWVTGAAPFEGFTAWLAARPAWIERFMWAMEVLPDGVYNWLAAWQGMRPHGELRLEMRRNRRSEVIHGVYGSILAGVRWDEVKGI
ncbi:alpha/beta-hydrolase, partial [Parathielavia appendiculata]